MSKLQLKKPLLKIGFVVNPVAGAGGPAALKGSDDTETYQAVLQGRIARRAPGRARQFLEQLKVGNRCCFVTVRGDMGENLFLQLCSNRAAGDRDPLRYSLLPMTIDSPTTAMTTQRVVGAMLDSAVDMIVFVGGDGTARDVCTVVGDGVPVLGVPSGVKMHSGVFAITPDAAAKVVDALVSGKLLSLAQREVRDIDEVAFQEGVVKSRYFGCMNVPDELRYVQNVKQGGIEVDALVLDDIAAEVQERLEEDENHNALLVFGTGSTVQYIQQYLGVPGTLLGVDLCFRSRLIACDADASTLENHISQHSGKVIIMATPIGGQGYVIGRGNQQLTPEVLRRAGRENLWIVASKTKLQSLDTRPLLMDSNDPELDRLWQGLVPVITGYRDQVLYRLGDVEH